MDIGLYRLLWLAVAAVDDLLRGCESDALVFGAHEEDDFSDSFRTGLTGEVDDIRKFFGLSARVSALSFDPIRVASLFEA